MSAFRIHQPFVDAPIKGVKRHGLSREALCDAAQLTHHDFANDGSLSTQNYAQLMLTIWRTSEDEAMGLNPKPVKFGTFAMMGKSVITCATLEHALRRASAFYRLIPHAPQIHIEKKDLKARIVIEQDQRFDPHHFLSESLLAIWHRFSSWLVGQGVPLLAVQCPYSKPPHAKLYDLVFATPVTFDSNELSLTIPTKALNLTVTQNAASLHQFLQHSPADILARPNPHMSMTAMVRNTLSLHSIATLPDLNSMASQLETSSATLRRRLRDEGSSYQKLKDAARLREAQRLLAEPGVSIADIAAKLGFTETSTFHRSFRNWTGQSPGAFRHRQGNES